MSNDPTYHAKISPSKLSRIMRCPASVRRSEMLEVDENKQESTYAAEGTLLHALAERILDALPDEAEIDYLAEARVFAATEEEAKTLAIEYQGAVEACIDYIQNEVTPLNREGVVFFQEMRVYSAVDPEINGTLDFGVVTPEAVHIVDFKFGRGVKVDIIYGEDFNEQLIEYLEGFMNFLNTHWHERFPDYAIPKDMFIHIAQPRIDNFQSAFVTMENVEDFRAKLANTMIELQAANPRINPGVAQCRWCPVGALCRERIQLMQSETNKLFDAVADIDKGILSVEDVSKLLKHEAAVKASYTAIRKFLFGAIAQGKDVPGYKIIRTSKHRTWKPGTTIDDIIKAVPEMEDKMDMLMATKMITAPQAEKLVGSKNKKALAELIIKPEGDYELTVESDKRDAVEFTNIADVFSSMGDDDE